MIGGALEPDAIIGDRYRLRRRLGEGGMGYVWEATHVFTHARFALKFLKGQKDEDRRRFVREVRAAAAVKHPNVIAVHDFVELPNATLVMVMDLLEGETLGQILKRDRRLPLADVAATLLPVVSALEAAHAVGIVHRDLKPDNVFLAKKAEGNEREVKVLDFGIAKLTALDGLAARTQALTGTGSMLGTPYYMSPEQIVADKDLDSRADVWSLGVVLYECLAGVRPTEADNVGRVLKRILLVDFDPITKHCEDLPEDVASLVAKMLVGDRDKRLRDLGEVRSVLTRHAAARISISAPTAQSDSVDAHADTVASAREPPEVAARWETHRAVSMAATRPSRARARLFAAAGVAVLGGAALVGWNLSKRTKAPIATQAVPMPTTDTSAIPSAAPIATSSAQPSDSPPEIPSGRATASALATASAPVSAPRTRSSASPRPSAVAVAGGTGTAPALSSTPAPPSIASASSQTPPRKPPPGLAAGPKD